jgi:hypothetical protein
MRWLRFWMIWIVFVGPIALGDLGVAIQEQDWRGVIFKAIFGIFLISAPLLPPRRRLGPARAAPPRWVGLHPLWDRHLDG